MKQLLSTIILAAAALLAAGCTSGSKNAGPCDIYRQSGTPCVTAHSTTRLLDSRYRGPLYQVQRDSDGATVDIYATKDGYANAELQDAFLDGTLGRITVIYDQSGRGNDLLPAPPGTFLGPDKGGFNNAAIANMAPAWLDGHKVYGVFIMPGMGYRCNNARGLAIDDEPEGMYYVIDGKHFDSGCCFDYGNSSTNGRAVGTGTMETTYYGTSTAWGRGNGEGPWIMSDMEAGLFSGYGAKQNDVPSITDWRFVSVFMNGGGGNQWDLRGADATQPELTTFYSGVRPGTPDSDAYFPMHKKGGMLLGNGGDNGNGSAGTFFEGVMTFGYPTDEAIAAVPLRAKMNGAVGNKQMIGSSTSEITGDIDVEIKLSKNGNLRTTIFSHSADQFSSYLDNSQRNGAGITYQMEFNSFTQLFHELFMTRQQREEQAARRLSGTGVPQSLIQIDSTGKPKVIEDGFDR